MALSHAIMTALLDESLSGYDLTRQFETSLGFFWAATHQQIYRELKALAAQGLLEAAAVAQTGRPDKVVYALTPAGRAALDAWVAAETRRKPAKDDLFVKLYSIGHSDPAPVLEEIGRRRREHAARLALYERIRTRRFAEPARLPARLRGVYLALAAGIRFERMFIDWCEEAQALLRSPDRSASDGGV